MQPYAVDLDRRHHIWPGQRAGELYSATEDHDVSLHQVHDEDGGRIRYQRTSEVCDNTRCSHSSDCSISTSPARGPRVAEGQAEVSPQELQTSASLVDNMSTDVAPATFSDEYQDQLKRLIAAKLEQGDHLDTAATFGEAGESAGDAEVVDLMEALRQSVERNRAARGEKKAPAKKAPARKAATKKKAPAKKKGQLTSAPGGRWFTV